MMALPTSVQRSLQLCPTGKSLIKNKKKEGKKKKWEANKLRGLHINLQLLVKGKDHRKSIRDALFFICHCKCRAVQPAVPPIRILIAL